MEYNESKEAKEADGNDIGISKDSKLYNALVALNDENIQKLIEEGDGEELIFSEEHNQKIQQLIGERFGPEAVIKMVKIQESRNGGRVKASEKHNVRKSCHFYPGMKKIAAAILVFGLLLAVPMSTEAFRQSIMNFILDVQKEFVAVNVVDSETLELSTESMPTIEKVYTLGKTLEGYKLISEEIDDMRVLRVYQNKDQDTYKVFQQNQAWNSYYNAEDTDYEMVETFYDNAMLSELNGIYSLVWVYDGYMFEISGSLTVQEFVTLAESLKLVKN